MISLRILLTIFTSSISAVLLEPPDFDVAQTLSQYGVSRPVIEYLSSRKGQPSCSDACSTLTSRYGIQYVLMPNETAYNKFREAYWSTIQSGPRPDCIFLPPDASAVSVLVLLSRMTQCPFAFKSGGHSAFAGAASIQGGITVSFQNLNGIALSDDKKIALVEPGNNWAQVYSKLADNELTVVGGRVARIGVGGLTLGGELKPIYTKTMADHPGGISFFSGFHGWACDNVEAYEVVTACGNIITATATDYPDLYWALRGGGNNFGIVIKFHLRTISIPGNNIWGGTRLYLQPQFPAVIQAFTDLALRADVDPRAGQWTAFGSVNQTSFASSTLWHSEPLTYNTTDIFQDFNSITAVSDTTGVRNLVDLVTEIQKSNPYGFREVYYCLTIKVSAELAQFAVDTFFEALPTVIDVQGVLPVLIFQTITVPQIVNMAQNGGNPLGLDPNDGPLFIISCPTWWQNAADDEKVYAFISGVLKQISDRAKEMGLQSEYIYMNYASQFEDVIRGYGAVNKEKLVEIALKYDPQRVFQVLQPGYFKLDGPPVQSDYFSGIWS